MRLRKIMALGIICMCLTSVIACNDNNNSQEKEIKTENISDEKNSDLNDKENNIEQKTPTIRDVQTTYIQDGEWEYFYYQNDRVYKKSGLVRRRLADGYVEKLIINDGEYVHYGENCGEYNIVGEWLYLTLKYAEDENYYICRMKKDGTEIERIVQENPSQMVVKDGYIYYWTWKNGNSYALQQVKLDGTEGKVILISEQIQELYDVIDGWVYFENYDEKEYSVRRIKTDGTNEEVVLKTSNFGEITYCDGWIYYETSSKNESGNVEGYEFSISRKKIDGTEEEIIVTKSSATLYSMHVVKDSLYFKSIDMINWSLPNTDVYCINVDGTGERIIDESEYPVTWIDMD